MIKGTHLITGFLLLVSLLAGTQPVQGQPPATSLAANGQVSKVTVGKQVMTPTSGRTTPVYVGPPVTIVGTHGVCGEYFVQMFNATAGEALTGSVSTNSPVNVYLMNAIVYKACQHQVVAGGTCTPSNPVASQLNTTSYTLSVTIPATGIYDLVVNNLSRSTVTAQITANLTSAAPTSSRRSPARP